MKKIILWGATGQSIVVEEYLKTIGFKIIAFFDNNPQIKSPFPDIPIYYGYNGFEEWKKEFFKKTIYFLVTIGGSKGKDRIELHKFLIKNGLKSTIAIHPTAYVAKTVHIGEGCQILANSTICARTNLGISTIINTSASIDHECIIGNGIHIGPGAKIAGCVEIGDFSFVGTGAIILPRLKIGKNVIVGAGSVVTKNISNDVICYGNPAKIISKNEEKVANI